MLTCHARRRSDRRHLGIGGAVIVACVALLAATASATPWRPTDSEEVLETVPRPADDARAAMRRLRSAVADDPDNLELMLDLARRYLEMGRTEADPRYDGYAEGLLAPWLERDVVPTDVLLLRAILRQRAHRFDAALADLEQVTTRAPGSAQAWLTQATVLQVLGEYGSARASCERLARTGTPLIATVCASQVMSLTGMADLGYHRLRRWIDAQPADDPVTRQWALVVLGEIAARRGETAAAAEHFRAALAMPRRNVYLLAVYADVLLDQGEAAQVRTLLADETRIDALLLRLVVAETRLGDADAPKHRQMLADRFAASRQRADSRHLREEARFLLEVENRPQAALPLALANWAQQREPADLRLVLAAAVAAGEPAAAQPAVRWIRDHGLQDAAVRPLLAALEEEAAPPSEESSAAAHH